MSTEQSLKKYMYTNSLFVDYIRIRQIDHL